MQDILAWDSRPERLGRIVDSLSALPVRVRPCSTLAQIRICNSGAPAALALVALGDATAARELSRAVVAELRDARLTVLAWEDGLASWPLRERCELLLGGIRRLLDSTAPCFLQDLRTHVAERLRAQTESHVEDRAMRDTLRRLGFVFESRAMLRVVRWVVRAGQLSQLPVLLTGETGTGKELLARAIHQLDPIRCRGPFVPLNCAALNHGLAESELFGHRRGAFTGAERDRKGLIRAADGGILFLDEVSELPRELQAKFLRVLQEGQVLTLGEEREVPVNVRVIAATNRELAPLVVRGEFRADLVHRLSVLVAQVPPLRERREDIRTLAVHFLEKHALLRPEKQWEAGSDLLDALGRLDWPGNARQLENVMRQLIAQKEDPTPLHLGDLPPELWAELASQGPVAGSAAPPVSVWIASAAAASPSVDLSLLLGLLEVHNWNLSDTLRHCERLLLRAALDRTGGNQSATARLLGITPRSVYNKLHSRRVEP